MSEMIPEIDEMPQMKTINVFETKETLINKNKYGNAITERSRNEFNKNYVYYQSSSIIQSVKNDFKLEDSDLINNLYTNTITNNSTEHYIHCRNCFLIIATESKILFNN